MKTRIQQVKSDNRLTCYLIFAMIVCPSGGEKVKDIVAEVASVVFFGVSPL